MQLLRILCYGLKVILSLVSGLKCFVEGLRTQEADDECEYTRAGANGFHADTTKIARSGRSLVLLRLHAIKSEVDQS